LTPDWLHHFSDRLAAAQSTRHGGVSEAPFASFNLGLHTPDRPEHVAENRQRFCESLGFDAAQLAGGFQTHGDAVRAVEAPGQQDGFDALVTNRRGVLLSVTVADCVPILLYDPVRGAIGAAHAGWKGTVASIAAKTLRTMQQHYGTQPRDCWAYIGTCIAKADFEVDADVADHFAAPYKHWDATRNKYFVDLKQANADSLLALGVPAAQLAISPHSTVTDVGMFFSHRAERGQTGRMLAVIGMRENV